eukprot:gene1741-2294_t
MPLEKNVLERFASGQPASLSDDENAKLFKQCKDLGLWALDVPEEVGGANLPAVALVGVNEELGYTCAMKTLVWRTLAEVNDLEIGGGGRGEAHKLTAASILFAGEACNRVLNK